MLDVDIYGPSLPTLIHPEDPTVRRSPIGKGMVLPIEFKGVKLLSLGFVSPEVSPLFVLLIVATLSVLDNLTWALVF